MTKAPEVYLWRSLPALSAEPIREICHQIEFDRGSVTEKAVFELKNGKFLYIRYSGMVDNDKSGLTDKEECLTLEEAKEIFDEF